MTRKLPQSPAFASAMLLLALAVATAPQARACKNEKTSSSPCSTPSSSEVDVAAMAASTGAVSIPDFGTECTTRSPAVPFASYYSTSCPAAKRTPSRSASRGSGGPAATRVAHETPAHAEQRPAPAKTEAKRTSPDPPASRASAPRGPDGGGGFVVSRPHRMPSPEIF